MGRFTAVVPGQKPAGEKDDSSLAGQGVKPGTGITRGLTIRGKAVRVDKVVSVSESAGGGS